MKSRIHEPMDYIAHLARPTYLKLFMNKQVELLLPNIVGYRALLNIETSGKDIHGTVNNRDLWETKDVFFKLPGFNGIALFISGRYKTCNPFPVS